MSLCSSCWGATSMFSSRDREQGCDVTESRRSPDTDEECEEMSITSTDEVGDNGINTEFVHKPKDRSHTLSVDFRSAKDGGGPLAKLEMCEAERDWERNYHHLREAITKYVYGNDYTELNKFFQAWGLPHRERENFGCKTVSDANRKNQTTIARLKRDKVSLQSENMSRLGEVEIANEKKSDVEKKYRVLQSQCNALIDENRTLQEANKTLLAEASLREKQHRIQLKKVSTTALKNYYDDLQAEISHLRKLAERDQKKIEAERKQATEAAKTTKRLYQMLQLSVVEQKDHATDHTFPNGALISKMVRRRQEDAVSFAFDLASLGISDYAEGCPRRPNDAGKVEKATSETKDYQIIVNEILVPCSHCADSCIEHFLREKERNISELLERDVRVFQSEQELAKNSLLELFVLSSMQKVVKARTDREDLIYGFADSYLADRPCLERAIQPEIVEHEDMEGRHPKSFLTDLVDLSLQCYFSSPRCYLWPPIGETVTFSTDDHVQKLLPSYKKKAKSGVSTVCILYPGLYFDDPTTSDVEEMKARVRPAVRAVVVLFDTGRNGNEADSNNSQIVRSLPSRNSIVKRNQM